ncbi:MAG: hypothetical protein GWO20_11325 [Candidatus Korarchaeota archaeon]|nr:hypothetical protein [Candidatus Korarchaeota archaeon]
MTVVVEIEEGEEEEEGKGEEALLLNASAQIRTVTIPLLISQESPVHHILVQSVARD